MAQPRTLPLTLVVRRGGRAATQGTPTGGIWIVQRGVLLAERILDDGGRWAFLLGPRDALGEPPGVDSAVDITALRPCLLRAVPLRDAGRVLATRGRSLTTMAAMLATATVAERVRWVLADVAARFGRPGRDGRIVGLRMSQELIAALAGTTRESANRALRVMEREGEVRRTGRGRYELPGPTDVAGIARVG